VGGRKIQGGGVAQERNLEKADSDVKGIRGIRGGIEGLGDSKWLVNKKR